MNSYCPFSQRSYDYYLNSQKDENWFNVLEGGKRAGKNIVNALAYCSMLDNHDEKYHLVAGYSIATAKINVLESNGLGIRRYFKGRCRDGEFDKKACLFVQTKKGEKIIFITGGGKAGDEKSIQGFTLGTVYLTEANLLTERFIKETFDRTIASKKRKIFHDLNPKGANHYYYTEILDFHEEQQKNNPNYGYNYCHMTIVDNYSLDNETIKKVLQTYDKSSIHYQRDILGKRINSEGLIYSNFASCYSDYLISYNDTKKIPYNNITIGVDFGGNKSKHAFNCVGLYNNYSNITVLKSVKVETNIDVDQLSMKLFEFVTSIENMYGKVNVIYCDNAGTQIIIKSFQNLFKSRGKNVRIAGATKTQVNERIKLVDYLLATQKLNFVENQTDTCVEALYTSSWDEKAIEDVRLDDGTTDIDSIDAFEYAIENYALKLLKR